MFFINIIYSFISIYSISATNLKEIITYKNSYNYVDFVQIPGKNTFSFLSSKGFSLYNINDNKMGDSILRKNISLPKLNHIMIVTTRNLIFSGYGCINYFDYINEYLNEKKFSDSNKEIINFFNKIHDQLFLSSTNLGNILQVKIKENNEFLIYCKSFSIINICSVFLKNLNIFYSLIKKVFRF